MIMAAFAAIVLSIQQAPPRDTRPPSTAATGRIIGVVTTDDTQPRPLRRARVAVNGPSLSTGWSVVTDDDGRFEFAGLAPGRYTVDALKDGYVPVSYGAPRPRRPGRSVNVAEGQTVTLSLRLPRGAVITGTVLDVDGQPAPGIHVMVLGRRFAGGAPADYVYPAAGEPAISNTDDHGVYRVYGLPAGSYIVSARPNPSLVAPGVSSAQVQMMTDGRVSSRRMLLTVVFHPGVTDVSRAERVSVRAGEERSGIDVQLEYVPIAMVSGTMPSPPGYGAARVGLWRAEGAGGPQTGPVVAYDEGRFQFASVPPGQYRITAVSMSSAQTDGGRGAAPPAAQIAVADVIVNGEDVDVPLSPRPALSISGQVVFDSQSSAPTDLPPGLHFNLTGGMTPASGGWPLPPVTLDGMRFRMDGVVPGLYRALSSIQGVRAPVGPWWLTSLTGGGRELLDVPFDIEENISDAVATFSDQASTLRGTVRDEQGAPVADPWIIVFPVDRRFWFVGSRRVVAARPNAQGAWTIRNLPPGDYRVIASLDVDQNEWFDPDILQRLLPVALPFTIAGVETKTLDLILR
jgi:protocatechuate 3,4-dioxygenase beta subunit